jgi:predicted RNase H-like HicB family nuclease
MKEKSFKSGAPEHFLHCGRLAANTRSGRQVPAHPPGLEQISLSKLTERVKLDLMLSQYLQAAMRHAKYEILEDDKSFYGEIPGFQGVLANAENLEDCRTQLEEVLEEWLFFRISRNLEIPVVDGIRLVIEEEAAA